MHDRDHSDHHAIIPFGSLPGVSISGAISEVAHHYKIPPAHLRRGDGRKAERIAIARHALFWKLTVDQNYPAERVAELLGCEESTVRKGAQLHQERIAEFQAQTELEPKT